MKSFSALLLATLVWIGACTAAAQAADYYVVTGQTGAQTQIDTNHTSSFTIKTTGLGVQFFGGKFTMKAGSATTSTVKFSLYDSLAPGAIPLAVKEFSYSAFCSQHGGTCTQFASTTFAFSTPVSLAAGRSYYGKLTSVANDVQSQAYFIKGGEGCFIALPDGTQANDAQCSYVAPSNTSPVLSISKSGPVTIAAQDEFSYSLVVTNNGTGSATTATIKDQLPTGAIYVSATGSGWNCSASGTPSLITCNFSGTIAVGGSSTITVNAKADGSVTPIVNRASVDPTGGPLPPDPSTCTTGDVSAGVCGSASTDVTAAVPDLIVSKSAPFPGLTASGNSTYELIVENQGGTAATTAYLYDALPADLAFVSYASTSGNWTCTPSGSPAVVLCTLNASQSIPAGGTDTISIVVSLPLEPAATTYVNKAFVGRDGNDISPPPTNSDTCETTATVSCSSNTYVLGAANLTITKSAPNPPLQIGVESVYTLVVKNNGTETVTTNAPLVDLMPAYMDLVSISNGWACTPGSTTVPTSNSNVAVSCQLNASATIAPNETQTLQLTVKPRSGIQSSVTNYASVAPTGTGSPPTPGPDCIDGATCADSTAGVTTSSALSIVKTSTDQSFTVNTTAHYALTVTNAAAGPSSVTTVKDQLPAGMSYVSAVSAQRWECNVSGNVSTGQLLSCTLAGALESASIINVEAVPGPSIGGTSITNWSSVGDESNPVPDPTGCNQADVCSSVTRFVASGGFTILKSQPNPPLQVKQKSVYTLTVTTDESNILTEVKDQLPEGMSFVSAVGAGWSCSVNATNLVTCSKTISSATVENIAIEVQPEAPINNQSVTNYASVGLSGQAPQPGPNCATAASPEVCASSAAQVADIREKIKKAVEEDVKAYMSARLDRIVGGLSNGSRLQRFRDSACGLNYSGSLIGDGTEKSANLQGGGAMSMRLGESRVVPTADALPVDNCGSVNLWSEFSFEYVTGSDDAFARTGLATLGLEYLVADNFLAGVKATIDYTYFDVSGASEANSEISGIGWFAGPYISAELVHNIFLDAFVGYGTSWNDYSGNYEGFGLSGEFGTQRLLGNATLTGEFDQGIWTLLPSVGVAYGKEWSDSFDVSNGELGPTNIDGQDAEIGRLIGRFEAVYHTMQGYGDVLDLFVAPTASYDFVRTDGAEVEDILGSSSFRAGIEGGVRYSSGSVNAGALIGYDGIGVENWNAYRGQLDFSYTW